MNVTKTSARGRTALCCALALCLALCGGTGTAALTASPAYAASDGSIALSSATSGDYYAYKLFVGSFRTDDDGTLQMGDAVLNADYEAAVLDALEQMGHEVDTSGLSDRALANAVLDEFLAIEEEGDASTLANLLAYLLESGGYAATETATADDDGSVSFAGLDLGYWLVAQASSDSEAMTTALLIAVDGAESADAKVTVPVPDKTVKDSETGGEDSEYSNTADAEASVDEDGTVSSTAISYRIAGTVASNIADYDTYYYAFHDDLPTAICFVNDTTKNASGESSRLDDAWSVSVVAGDASYDVTDSFAATFTYTSSTGVTTVNWEVEDLIAVLESLGVDEADWADVQVVLEYSIAMTSDELEAYLASTSTLLVADVLANYARIEYSNNPYENNPVTSDAGSTDESVEDEAYLYTFNLDVTKLDEDGETLSGAVFTLTRTDTGEEVGYQIVDDEDGSFVFTGLQADVEYTLTESSVPSGYKSIDPIRFTITAVVSDDGATVESIEVDPDATTDPSGATTITTSGATVVMTVVNVEGYDLPLTGAAGVALLAVLAAALVAAGAVVVTRRRKAGSAEDEAPAE